ncbi:hypothetical protein EKL30_12605 [Candidimonas sp. SYP-B2681]|uniref:hypothetical protein n=1 Tax=Candidimonas sp. SYP-B2681 TaxID=2497686 RepID=UPI000F891F65|nr:hypothetical protein [Candidimonas sp. SYP-B2681]RTZ42533.1 hypothetical protein EKL30_12605 [Candidimonas sp. SYP-B2681]
MIKVDKETRLTDELERQLMMQAIEEQFRFKPIAAVKNLSAKVASLFSGNKAVSAAKAQSAR